MKKIVKILSIVCVLAMVLAPTTVYATSPSNGDTQTTDVSYTVSETEWTWSVPATQVFTDSALTKTGNVAITPVDDVIVLPSGTSISVAMTSANNFKLVNGSSNIAYTVSNGSTLANNATVLTYTAGTSANTGVSETLTFATTAANIQNATLTGAHTDTLTFTLSIAHNINFTIDGLQFTANQGSTWETFVNSYSGSEAFFLSYYDSIISTGEVVIIFLDGYGFVCPENSDMAVQAHEVIQPNATYITMMNPQY